MWDNRWGIFVEGVTPEVDLGQFGIHSKADKERLLITSTDRVYLSSSREAQERQVQSWHDNSTVSSKTQDLPICLPHHLQRVFHFQTLTSLLQDGSCASNSLFCFLDRRNGWHWKDKDSLDKFYLCIWEWVPFAGTSTKNSLFRTVAHGHS